MKRSSFTWIASLAFFSLGTASLWGTDYYVRQPSEPGSVTGCSDCASSTNTCCTFLDAINAANNDAPTPATIHITVSEITYQGSLGSLCNETGIITIVSDVGGSIINFNDQTAPICLSIFQPTYVSSNSPGTVALQDVVLQNAAEGLTFINLAGGSVTINGTSVNSGQDLFSNNSWTVGLYNGNQPSFTFEEGGEYEQPFEDSFAYIVNGTIFDLTNNHQGTVTVSGDIGVLSGITGSVLQIYPTNGSVILSGPVTVDTLTVHEGNNTSSGNTRVQLTGSSNEITTVNLADSLSNVYISSSQSLGSSTLVNMNEGTLSFTNAFTLDSGITIALNGAENTLFDLGNNVQIDSLLTGTGTYIKSGSGIQTLTNTNTYTGGTTIAGGAISISAAGQIGTGTITIVDSALLATASLTIPSTNIVSVLTLAELAASEGTTLTVQANLEGSGTLQIGTSKVNSASGTVVLQGTTNTRFGAVVVGSVSNSVNYPATLSVDSMDRMGDVVSVTLQGEGVFVPTTSFETFIPLYIGTGTGSLFVGPGITFTESETLYVADSATGPILLNITGGGTVVLNGSNNAFSGDFLVNNTTLQVGTTGNLGNSDPNAEIGLSNNAILSVTGDVTILRTLALEASNTINVASSITAAFNGILSIDTGATLTKIGYGTLSLLPTSSQTNTDFNLAVTSGSVIGNTFALENTTITVAASTDLEFFQSSSGTFHGAISGSGSVSIAGTAPLTFAPIASTYTGGTFVSGTLVIASDVLGDTSSILYGEGGTVQSTADFSMARNISLTQDCTFSTNAGTVLELAGVISSTGDLIKTGSGALVLTGNSTYTGKTYVDQGALVVTGNIVPSGDPIVGSNAIMSGTGSVGTSDVYGTIKGGSLVDLFGTLTIDGDLILEEGSSFGTVISPSTNSLLEVTGNITISPDTVYLIAPVAGNYQTFSRVVLSGNSITGQFSTVDTFALSASFLTSSIVYTGTEVILDTSNRSIAALATGQNAINVANALDEVIHYNRTQITYSIEPGRIVPSSPPELVPIMASLLPITTTSSMTYALNQLHPAQFKGMAISQENNAILVRESLSQRMRNELDMSNCFLRDNYDVQEKNCCEKNQKMMTAWMGGIQEFVTQNTKNNDYWGPLPGYLVNTGGVTAGVDALFANHFYAGALGGYTHSHLHWKSGRGTGDISSGYAGIYLSAIKGVFYANASLIGSWSHYSANRNIEYERIKLVAKNGHGGSQLLSHADTGLNFHYLGLTVRPFESFDYIAQRENSYHEYNAGAWDLQIEKRNALMKRNELGLQFAKCYCFLKLKWTLSPKASWVREVRVKGDDFTVRFHQAGPEFRIQGYFPSRNLFATGMTLTGCALQDALKFDLYYNGEFGNKYVANSYGGQLRFGF